MATTSALDLSQKLEQRKLQDQQAEQRRIQQLQQLHETSLQQLSQAALATTKSVTASQSELLAAALKHEKQLLQQHVKQLKEQLQSINSGIDTLGEATSKRLTWLLMWPVLASFLVSILVICGALLWSWWTVSQVSSQSEKILSDQRMKLEQMNIEFCSSPAGKKYCRPAQ